MPKNTSHRLLILALTTALAGACSADPRGPTSPDGGGGGPDPTATLSRIQAEVLTPRCAVAGCHVPPAPPQGLRLDAGEAWSNLVAVPARQSNELRVDPGSPEASYLVAKIEGEPGISGQRMPYGGPYLSDEEIQLVVDWIRRGAPND